MTQETNWLAATLPELLSAASARATVQAPGWVALRDAATHLDQRAFSALTVIDAGGTDARGLNAALGGSRPVVSLDDCDAEPLSTDRALRLVIAVPAGRTLDARAVRLLSAAVGGRPGASWRLVVTGVESLAPADVSIQDRLSANLCRQLDAAAPDQSVLFWSSSPSAHCAERVASATSALRAWSETPLARDVRDALEALGLDRLRAFAALQASTDAPAGVREPDPGPTVPSGTHDSSEAAALNAHRRVREALTEVRAALNGTFGNAPELARTSAGRFDPEQLATSVRRKAAGSRSPRSVQAREIVEGAWNSAVAEFDTQLSQQMDIWRRLAREQLSRLDWRMLEGLMDSEGVVDSLVRPAAAVAPPPFQGQRQLNALFDRERETHTIPVAAGGALAGLLVSLLLPGAGVMVAAAAALTGGAVGAVSRQFVARSRQADVEHAALLETLRQLRSNLEIDLRRRADGHRRSVEDDLVRRVEALLTGSGG